MRVVGSPSAERIFHSLNYTTQAQGGSCSDKRRAAVNPTYRFDVVGLDVKLEEHIIITQDDAFR
jgi:hypothetical protein